MATIWPGWTLAPKPTTRSARRSMLGSSTAAESSGQPLSLAPVKPRRGAKRIARRLGYEVRPYTPLRSLAAARERLFARLGIDLVLDVGANAGQYGAMLREQGFTGRLVSLEPVPEAFEQLRRRAAADGAWTALDLAASDADGELAINVTDDSRSSSVLARNERFADRAGWTPK